MSKKFFVENRTDREIAEYKPGLGNFVLKPHSKIQFPEDIAKSVVQDFQAPGLELVIEEDKVLKEVQIAPKPVVKTVNKPNTTEVKTIGKREANKSVSNK